MLEWINDRHPKPLLFTHLGSIQTKIGSKLVQNTFFVVIGLIVWLNIYFIFPHIT